MDTHDAVRKAKSVGLDLVEVSTNAKPPVCKILDYGKYKYEQQKKKENYMQQNFGMKYNRDFQILIMKEMMMSNLLIKMIKML